MEFIPESAEAILIMKRRQVSRNAGDVLSREVVHRIDLVYRPYRIGTLLLFYAMYVSTDYSLVLRTEMDYVKPFFLKVLFISARSAVSL